MKRPRRFQQRLAIAVLFGLWGAVSPAPGQQPNSQQPPPPKSDPQPGSSKGEKDKKEGDQPGATVGKSKLEKETGTVNDRIFEVLPNYGTGENAEDLPALYSWTKIPAGNRRGLRLGRLSLQRCFSLESRRQGMIQGLGTGLGRSRRT